MYTILAPFRLGRQWHTHGHISLTTQQALFLILNNKVKPADQTTVSKQGATSTTDQQKPEKSTGKK